MSLSWARSEGDSGEVGEVDGEDDGWKRVINIVAFSVITSSSLFVLLSSGADVLASRSEMLCML